MKMKLFSVHAIANKNTTNNNSFVMPIMYTKPAVLQNQPLPPQPQNIPAETPKKVKWGKPIWYLFHTLSVKVKDSEFAKIRSELLMHIYTICVNLPCPDCARSCKIIFR
jgi:hypothetical protein